MIKNCKVRWPILVFLVPFFLTLTAFSANACVGRKLVLGSLEDERSAMVTRILSILIHERTGTTVEVKFYSGREDLLDGVAKEKVDLYVDYVDDALSRLEDKGAGLSPEERMALVKRRFEEERNLVWLKPMGFSGPSRNGSPAGAASTVVHKETLKKFPALPRLLEKIGTRIVLDDGTLKKLVDRGKSDKPAKVARDYLKEVKLI